MDGALPVMHKLEGIRYVQSSPPPIYTTPFASRAVLESGPPIATPWVSEIGYTADDLEVCAYM